MNTNSLLAVAIIGFVLWNAGAASSPQDQTVPSPAANLQVLAAPITTGLAAHPEDGPLVAAFYERLALKVAEDGVDAKVMNSTAAMQQIEFKGLKVLRAGRPPLGLSEAITKVTREHCQLDDGQGGVKNVAIDDALRRKLVESYQAISWAASQ